MLPCEMQLPRINQKASLLTQCSAAATTASSSSVMSIIGMAVSTMAIVDDYAAIAAELSRLQDERWSEARGHHLWKATGP